MNCSVCHNTFSEDEIKTIDVSPMTTSTSFMAAHAIYCTRKACKPCAEKHNKKLVLLHELRKKYYVQFEKEIPRPSQFDGSQFDDSYKDIFDKYQRLIENELAENGF